MASNLQLRQPRRREQSPSRGRSRHGRLAGAAIAAAALTGVVLLVADFTQWGQTVENALLFGTDESRSLAYVPYEYLRIPPLRFEIPTILVGLAFAILIAAVRRRWRELVTVLVAVPGSILLADGLARVLVKPPLDPGAPVWKLSSSFPSGHVAIVVALSVALLIVVPPRWVRWCAPILAGWIAFVASAVLALGWHRPSDVIGAALLVMAVFLAATAIFGVARTPVRRPEMRLQVAALVTVASAILFAVQPVVWEIPIFAAVSVAVTGATVFVALRWCRS